MILCLRVSLLHKLKAGRHCALPKDDIRSEAGAAWSAGWSVDKQALSCGSLQKAA
jgi:hypothetical protein